MASRRQAHACHRRGAHHARRTGGILQQGTGSSEGPDDSAKAAKSAKAQKAQKP